MLLKKWGFELYTDLGLYKFSFSAFYAHKKLSLFNKLNRKWGYPQDLLLLLIYNYI